MLLPLLVVYEHWFRKPGGRRAYLYHLAPLAMYFALRTWALGGLIMVAHPFSHSLSSHVYAILNLAGIYLGRLVAPAPFNLQGHLQGHLQGMLDPASSLPNWGFGAWGVPGRGRRLAPVAWPEVVVRRALDCVPVGAPALPLPGCGGQLFRRAVSLPAFGGFLLDRGSAVSGAPCRLRPSFAELRPAHLLPQCRLAPGLASLRRFDSTLTEVGNVWRPAEPWRLRRHFSSSPYVQDGRVFSQPCSTGDTEN